MSIKDLEAQQAEANRSFWRSAAFTAVSVTVFTVSAIALDMGVTLAEAATLQIVAAVSAVGSIGGAAFAQGSSSKIDRIEADIELERTKEIERTTEREVAPQQEKKPERVVEKQAEPSIATTRHIEAAAKKISQTPQHQR